MATEVWGTYAGHMPLRRETQLMKKACMLADWKTKQESWTQNSAGQKGASRNVNQTFAIKIPDRKKGVKNQ